MSDPRIDLVAAAIEKRFPGTKVVRRRCPDPSAYDIECILDVLDAPIDPPLVVADFALTYAFEVFGDDPVPIFVHACGPDESVGRARTAAASGSAETA